MTEQTYTLAKLQMFEECPQKYKMCYIDKVHIVENINKDSSNKGNHLHSLINYYLKGMDITKLVSALTPQEKQLWINFKDSNIKNYKYITSEYSFNLKLDNYWLTGRIDALFAQDKNFIVVDWKTGENFNPKNTKFQTAFYLLCLYEILRSKNLIKTPEQLSMQYLNLAENNAINVTFDDTLYQQYKSQILNTINKINENKYFFCNKTGKCPNCKYYKSCPFE